MRINQLIRINNNKIEVQYKGNSGPLIVILTGMGCSFDEWYNIIENVYQNNRILTFHRQGLGQSEIGGNIRGTESTVQDLVGLLDHFKIKEPIYVVGHSYGGLCAQHFAKAYPDRVAGVILVDSTSVELEELDQLELPVLNEETDEVWIEKCLIYATRDKENLRKIIKPLLHDKHRYFPLAIQQRILDFQVNPSLYKAMAMEIREWKNDAEIIKDMGDFPDIPLIVIGRDTKFAIKLELKTGVPLWEITKFEEKWAELITNQAKLSTKGEIIIASNSGHSVYLDRSDLLIDCINQISSK